MGEATRKWEQIIDRYSSQGVRAAWDSDESAAAPLAEDPPAKEGTMTAVIEWYAGGQVGTGSSSPGAGLP